MRNNWKSQLFEIKQIITRCYDSIKLQDQQQQYKYQTFKTKLS